MFKMAASKQPGKSISLYSSDDLKNMITKSDMPSAVKDKILKSIDDNGISGSDLVNIKTAQDLAALGLSIIHATKWFQLLSKENLINNNNIKNKSEEELEDNQQDNEQDEAKRIQQLLQQECQDKYEDKEGDDIKPSGKNDNNKLNYKSLLNLNANNNNNEGFILSFHDGTKFHQTDKLWYKNNTIRQLKEYYVDKVNGGEIDKLNFCYKAKVLKEDNKTLASYDIIKACTIIISFKVKGGLSHYWNENNKKKRVPNWKKYPKLKPSLKEDCIMGYNDKNSLRVEMPCGHVFAPITIYQYITMLKENLNAIDIYCPIKECSANWDIELVCAAADLTSEESGDLQQIIEGRKLKNADLIRNCPICKSWVSRPDDLTMLRVRCEKCDSSDFCWTCGKQWQGGGFTICGNEKCPTLQINETLKPQNCGWAECKQLPKESIPAMRACPRCLTLVIHDKECKHIKCWKCHKQFCFVCLSLQNEQGEWSCNGPFDACPVHPIQVLK